MKLSAFDLEISKELPEGASDWKEHRPLGISCAAVCNAQSEYSLFAEPSTLFWTLELAQAIEREKCVK